MSKFNYRIEGSRLLFDLDINEDGEPSAGMFIDFLEIPDEIMTEIFNKKEEVKE